jgi:NAD(P)-dependent dehydrogenase (short-subunit alcohol dehydrogenase family)
MCSATTSATGQSQLDLAGQTVVLIGGSAGIGLETGRCARAHGANVILTGTPDDQHGTHRRDIRHRRRATVRAVKMTDAERIRVTNEIPASSRRRIECQG